MSIAILLTLTLTVAQAATQPAPTPAQPAAVDDGLGIQVALDRAGFSPGVIDGRIGPSTRKALDAYRKRNTSAPEPMPDALTRYRITAADAAGPFAERIPRDLVEQSKLERLAYTSVVEALAERFHTTPALLQRVNRGATFAAGEEIVVPNVEPLKMPVAETKAAAGQSRGAAGRGATGAAGTSGTSAGAAGVVTVSRASSALTVTDAGGRVIFYAPVTTGSERDPLPIGEWTVTSVQMNPTFNYNPDLFWDADPAHSKARIPPGPNNPVGLVWIDLSKEHYGIHGTPEPSTIGRTESHGCIRLTNWDAVKLAGLVAPGTRVVFTP